MLKARMESKMTPSHSPQLCAPLSLPPPVGSQISLTQSPFVDFSTSSTLHSHGGLYAQLRQSFSTRVPRWTLTGFRETAALRFAAKRIVATASFTASASVKKG